jgi:UPF0042 nucleotide-binding protein
VKDDRFIIITGLSGSGKTSVSRFLEDLGYYCIDNLPAKLIPSFVDLWMREEFKIEKVALVVDIREEGFTTEFPNVLRSIRKKIPIWMIFLEASNETIVQRFSESRRPHPLMRKRSVIESVSLERERMAEIKAMADEVLDTTGMSVWDMKKLVTKRFLRRKTQQLQVVIVSFGYKYGIPVDSDMVFDTRFLPNPFYINTLREKTGRSKSVRGYVLQSEGASQFLEELYRFVDHLMPKFVEEGKSTLTISVGCTGGKHRSVVCSEELKKHLRANSYNARINHRDIYK